MRALCGALLLAALAAAVSAHEIPADVTARLFVKPEGQKLRVLIRVPLASINDVVWPVFQGNGTLLDLGRAEATLRNAANQWLGDFIKIHEDGRQLDYPTLVEVRASLPGDQSFAEYDTALAHLTAPPLAADTNFIINQGLLDAYYEYSIGSDRARFAIEPNFETLGIRVLTVMKFLPPDGGARAFEYQGRRGLVHFDPTWRQATQRFLAAGLAQSINGLDYLLFAICLVLPFRRLRTLLPVVGAFVAGHAITLFASAYGMAPATLWFQPLIVTLAAAAIVYVAVENVIGATPARRSIAAFVFGLAFGFAFSFVLNDTLQFAGLHRLSALVAFTFGLEIALAAALLLIVPTLSILFTRIVSERSGTIIVSALAAHTAWHWMTARYWEFSRHPIAWPAMNAAFFAVLARWAMVVVALCGIAWLLNVLRQSRRGGKVNSEV